MELSTSVVNLRHAELLGRIQFAVARRILDQQRLDGAAAVRLIESASRGATSAGDALVAAATGLGNSLDTYG